MRQDEVLEDAHSERGQRLSEHIRLAQANDRGIEPPPLHVLVVEDDVALRDIVTLALLDEGYEIASASNGAEALERIGQYEPDVILLDLHMPVMDGPSFAERYHAQPGPHAPIVVFTAGGDAQGWAHRIRAAAYVNKPVDLWALGALLHRCATGEPEVAARAAQ